VTGGAAIVVDGVHKSFEDGGVRALRGASFRVEPGELVALVGASGSGKSTMLNLLGALDTPDEGTIAIDGSPIDDASAYRSAVVGFVFQSHNLLPTLTASENVQVAMFGRRPRHERAARALDLLREVGLAHRVQARPGVLSGGERQRVAIARALANEPRLVLADEPTGALDSETGTQVLALLDELRRARGTTIVLVTNDDGVAGHADRVLRLHDGVIRAEAPRQVPA
jgi:putative ABC transport system ATP-binding protein